jgi:putative SOS response-associated peptidase YedK
MTLTRSGSEIADYFAEAMAEAIALESLVGPEGGALRPRYNVTPSQPVLTVVPFTPAGGGAARPAGLRSSFEWRRWGLVPGWARDPSIGQRMFNARCETVAEKPAFRAAYRRRRCLVVADGFYEWSPRPHGHRPFYFTASDAPLLCLAGLYEHWSAPGSEAEAGRADGPSRIESCTVLTSEANPDLSGIHHRMPVILAPGQLTTWLDPAAPLRDVETLLRPAAAGTLARVEVGRYVNDPRHDDPTCVRPVDADAGSGSAGREREGVGAVQGRLFAGQDDAGDDQLGGGR